MAKKTRLHLLIEQEQAERLKEFARRRDVSVSWLVRRAIELLLRSEEAGEASPPPSQDPLLNVLGSFTADPLRSPQIDAELYAPCSSDPDSDPDVNEGAPGR